jgi:hypothetical protein
MKNHELIFLKHEIATLLREEFQIFGTWYTVTVRSDFTYMNMYINNSKYLMTCRVRRGSLQHDKFKLWKSKLFRLCYIRACHG